MNRNYEEYSDNEGDSNEGDLSICSRMIISTIVVTEFMLLIFVYALSRSVLQMLLDCFLVLMFGYLLCCCAVVASEYTWSYSAAPLVLLESRWPFFFLPIRSFKYVTYVTYRFGIILKNEVGRMGCSTKVYKIIRRHSEKAVGRKFLKRIRPGSYMGEGTITDRLRQVVASHVNYHSNRPTDKDQPLKHTSASSSSSLDEVISSDDELHKRDGKNVRKIAFKKGTPLWVFFLAYPLMRFTNA